MSQQPLTRQKIEKDTKAKFDTHEARKTDANFEARITDVLKKANHLSDRKHILGCCDSEIAKLAGISYRDVCRLKEYIAADFWPKEPVNALQIFRDKELQPWRLSTCCPVIDSSLKGGILSGMITEISGESASGKTQLCLQLCLSVQLNETHSGGGVYICTEDVFPSRRLQQLIKFFNIKKRGWKFGDNIFIEHIADFEGLDRCIEHQLPLVLARGCARLVVIDSVAALFRCHYTQDQTLERAQHLLRLASVLQRLASKHNIPIICVNQVSANVEGPEESLTGRETVIPSLGLTWANQVKCRLMMSRPHVPLSTAQGTNVCKPMATHRRLSLIWAPHLPTFDMDIYIDDSGLHGIQTVQS